MILRVPGANPLDGAALEDHPALRQRVQDVPFPWAGAAKVVLPGREARSVYLMGNHQSKDDVRGTRTVIAKFIP